MGLGDEEYALNLEQLSELVESAAREPAGGPSFRRFEACLRRPRALAASFRRGGGQGAQDYSAVAAAVSALVLPRATPAGDVEASRAEAIMEALHSAFAGARPRRRGGPNGEEPQAQRSCEAEGAAEAQLASEAAREAGPQAGLARAELQDGERWGSWEQGWARDGAPVMQQLPPELHIPEQLAAVGELADELIRQARLVQRHSQQQPEPQQQQQQQPQQQQQQQQQQQPPEQEGARHPVPLDGDSSQTGEAERASREAFEEVGVAGAEDAEEESVLGEGSGGDPEEAAQGSPGEERQEGSAEEPLQESDGDGNDDDMGVGGAGTRRAAGEEEDSNPALRRRLDDSADVSGPADSASPADSAVVAASELVPGDLGVDCSWVLAAMAAALPLIEGALPKDERGECVLPHQHRMRMVQADLEGMPVRFWGTRAVYITGKVCDRCMDTIVDRVFYHCSGDCDVDFCAQCHEELQHVLDRFFDCSGCGQAAPSGRSASPEHMVERMLWSVHAADELACRVLFRDQGERLALGRLLAFEWPVELFARLASAVVNVCNAKMLYNATQGAMTTSVRRACRQDGRRGYFQEVCPIYRDKRFWCSVGLLQFIYSCNSLPREQVLDGHGVRGPRIAPQDFVLEGINKCQPEVEWHHFLRHPVTHDLDLLHTPVFKVSRSFRSLVAHSNLLPISFRRRCLLADVRTQMDKDWAAGDRSTLVLRVEREPAALVEAVVEAFNRQDEEAPAPDPGPEAEAALAAAAARPERKASRLRRPLSVVFGGEAGQGPGVRREFFQVAIRAFLAALFVPTGGRTFWFSGADRPEAYFACGVLLGQAVLHDVLIPNLFPWTLFDLLLRDLRSPHAARTLGLAHLAAVSHEEADSLKKVLSYEGDDIGAVFGDLGWERTGRLEGLQLTQGTKAVFVSAYVDWCLVDRIRSQFVPLSAGFQVVVGSSVMVRKMVDAAHLERIVCGGEVPVDIAVLRRRAIYQGWADEDQGYLDAFWAAVQELPEASKRSFLVFVTASDRVPLRGWDELRLTVQKNGSGDERLPTAYTCFALLLLPRFTSAEVLKRNLLQAINNSEGFGLN